MNGEPNPAGKPGTPPGLYGRLRPPVARPPGGGAANGGPTAGTPGGGSPGDDPHGPSPRAAGLSLRTQITISALVAALLPLAVGTALFAIYGELGRDPAILRLIRKDARATFSELGRDIAADARARIAELARV